MSVAIFAVHGISLALTGEKSEYSHQTDNIYTYSKRCETGDEANTSGYYMALAQIYAEFTFFLASCKCINRIYRIAIFHHHHLIALQCTQVTP